MSIEYLEHDKGIELMAKLLVDGKLTPIIGSGFTAGCNTPYSKVPDGCTINQIMKEAISQCNPSLSVGDYLLSKTSRYFFEIVQKKQRDTILRNCFTDVSLSLELKDFLNLPWTYIYTLNVDDAIEKNGYNAILPYHDAFFPEHREKVVYKMHGDVHYELNSQTDKNLVFSFSQYVNTLTDPHNKTLIDEIKSDYIQKNLVFIGCSLEEEPDLKYIYDEVRSDLSVNNIRAVVRNGKLTSEQEINLSFYGINTVILVNNYRTFYLDFTQKVNSLRSSRNANSYEFVNPSFINDDDKEKDIDFFAGKYIFMPEKNAFYKSNLMVKRNILSDLETAIMENDAVLLQGRRFSGKTHLLSMIVERFQKYNILFFPSNTSFDENVISKLIKGKKDSLFLFDSSSLSEYAYQEVAYAKDDLKFNNSKVVIAVNSKDVFLSDTLCAKTIHINPKFEGKELDDMEKAANKYGLIKREKSNTSIDYLKNISEQQGIKIEILSSFPTSNFTKYEMVMLLMLCVHDKFYLGDVVALGIPIRSVDLLVNKMNGILEKVPVSKNEKSNHSSEKLIHNSKYVLMSIMSNLKMKEIVDTIIFIVSKLKNDKFRRRLYVEVVLFDTLNQLFGKNSGAGNVIREIYDSLENYLYDEMDYWLQRAKSIYRMDSNNYEQLKQAYSYAKKAHCDGDNRIQAKSALTSSVICSLLSNIRDISSTEIAEYENKAIEYAYAAITSDYFKRLPQKLEDEFEKKRSRSKGYSFYKRLSDICEKRILNCSDELSKKILEINKALKDSERSPVKI